MKKKVLLLTILISICTGNTYLFGSKSYTNSLPDISLDLPRYMGKWYEIARMPHFFEKNLVGVSATYTLNTDGTVKVQNEGYLYTLKGKKKQAIGIAKPLPNKKNALKVSFFRPFYAGYYVIEIADDYSYALVAGDTPNYLWILSREKKLDPLISNRLLEKAKSLGIQTEKIEWIEQ